MSFHFMDVVSKFARKPQRFHHNIQTVSCKMKNRLSKVGFFYHSRKRQETLIHRLAQYIDTPRRKGWLFAKTLEESLVNEFFWVRDYFQV
jgi:hypothetical protein